MSDLIKANSAQVALNPASATINDNTTIEEWAKIGHSLKAANRAMQWWIGDWLNHGVKAFGERKALAIDHAEGFGIEREALSRAAATARAIDQPRRVAGLTFRHHEEVQMELGGAQDTWLGEAQERQWSVTDLRRAIRASKALHAVDEDEAKGFDASFNPTRIKLDFSRWLAKQPPASEWTQAKRDAIKRDLEPLARLWGEL